jgi:hypothetical protein
MLYVFLLLFLCMCTLLHCRAHPRRLLLSCSRTRPFLRPNPKVGPRMWGLGEGVGEVVWEGMQWKWSGVDAYRRCASPVSRRSRILRLGGGGVTPGQRGDGDGVEKR